MHRERASICVYRQHFTASLQIHVNKVLALWLSGRSVMQCLTDDVLVQAAAEPACLQCVPMELSHWAALIGAAEVLLLRATSLEIILQEVR